MDEHRRVDYAASALVWIERILEHLDFLALTDNEIAATAAIGHRHDTDPALAWTQLDYAEGLVNRLHARMGSLSAAFARERLRALSPAERDELPAGYVIGLLREQNDVSRVRSE